MINLGTDSIASRILPSISSLSMKSDLSVPLNLAQLTRASGKYWLQYFSRAKSMTPPLESTFYLAYGTIRPRVSSFSLSMGLSTDANTDWTFFSSRWFSSVSPQGIWSNETPRIKRFSSARISGPACPDPAAAGRISSYLYLFTCKHSVDASNLQ